MKNVIVTRNSNIHYLAQCLGCNWEAGVGADGTEQQVRNATYRHVRKTGHRVIIENANATYYELEERANTRCTGREERAGELVR